MMFPGWANERDTNGRANRETFVADTNIVSKTNIARTGKRGNICVRNIVSSFASNLISERTENKPYLLKDYFFCWIVIVTV